MTDGERDCALFLLDADARIAVWYPGAEIIYQYKSDETVGWHMSIRGHGKRGAGEEEGNGDLQGFAVIVRDFSDLRQRHEQLRRGALHPSNRPSSASFRERLIAFRRRMTRVSNSSATAARNCRPVRSSGPLSHQKNTRL
jgi:hypothetical protein